MMSAMMYVVVPVWKTETLNLAMPNLVISGIMSGMMSGVVSVVMSVVITAMTYGKN